MYDEDEYSEKSSFDLFRKKWEYVPQHPNLVLQYYTV
jgi:hypothetical protein